MFNKTKYYAKANNCEEVCKNGNKQTNPGEAGIHDVDSEEQSWQQMYIISEHLANLVESPFSQNVQQCKDEHGQFESLFSDVIKHFRQIRKELFALTEHIMESETAKHFLNGN